MSDCDHNVHPNANVFGAPVDAALDTSTSPKIADNGELRGPSISASSAPRQRFAMPMLLPTDASSASTSPRVPARNPQPAAIGRSGNPLSLTVQIPFDRSLGDSQECFALNTRGSSLFHYNASHSPRELSVLGDEVVTGAQNTDTGESPLFAMQRIRRATLPPAAAAMEPTDDNHLGNPLRSANQRRQSSDSEGDPLLPVVGMVGPRRCSDDSSTTETPRAQDGPRGSDLRAAQYPVTSVLPQLVVAVPPGCVYQPLSSPQGNAAPLSNLATPHHLSHGTSLSMPVSAAETSLRSPHGGMPLITPTHGGIVPTRLLAPSAHRSTFDEGNDTESTNTSAAPTPKQSSGALFFRPPLLRSRGRDAIDELLPHSVYISGLRGAQNTALLAELGVTAFLNVAVDVPMPEHVLARAPGPSTVLDARLVAEVAAAGGASGGGGVYEYLHLPLRDKGDEVLADHFTSAFAFIRGCRREQRRVLLFCREGKSRSGSIAIAFIMDECRLTYDDASEYVKRCRSVVDPNISFCSQLSNASQQIHSSGDTSGRQHTISERSPIDTPSASSRCEARSSGSSATGAAQQSAVTYYYVLPVRRDDAYRRSSSESPPIAFHAASSRVPTMESSGFGPPLSSEAYGTDATLFGVVQLPSAVQGADPLTTDLSPLARHHASQSDDLSFALSRERTEKAVSASNLRRSQLQ